MNLQIRLTKFLTQARSQNQGVLSNCDFRKLSIRKANLII